MNKIELEIDDDFKNLIPPLKEDELEKLEESILKEGIRDKLVIWNETIIDGHNRYSIAKKHDLEFNTTKLHFLSKEEAVNWMLNNQLGRRNLTPQQRVDVLFQAEELIKSIYEKGKVRVVEGGERGGKKEGFDRSNKGLDKPPHNSRKEIAKLAKTSPATVGRMKKIRDEDPEAYQEVVRGEKAVYTAYNDLPTVTNKQAEKDGFVKKHERDDSEIDEPEQEIPSVIKKRMRNQAPPEMTDEQIKAAMFNANVLTFFRHLSEVEGFVGRTESFEDVVKESVKRDEASMKDYKEALNKIITLLEDL